jgi:hypothetical protein
MRRIPDEALGLVIVMSDSLDEGGCDKAPQYPMKTEAPRVPVSTTSWTRRQRRGCVFTWTRIRGGVYGRVR